jgi:hemerythrin-like domain-containing protein
VRGKKKTVAGRKKSAPAKRPVARAKAARRKTAARGAATRTRTRRTPPRPSRLAAAATLIRGAAAGAVVAVTARLPWSKDENDPIVLLETDHRRFEDLLKQGEATTERAVKRRTDLLATLTAELNVHELIEEKILYPALKAHPQGRDIVLEGYQEHHVADLIVKELHDTARDDERWGAKFKVLKESIEHHIEEEEGQMFRTARAVFSRDELHDLGARMKALRAEHGG